MAESIVEPKPLSPHAPRIVSVKIPAARRCRIRSRDLTVGLLSHHQAGDLTGDAGFFLESILIFLLPANAKNQALPITYWIPSARTLNRCSLTVVTPSFVLKAYESMC